MPTKCRGTNKRGETCSAYVADGHEWCQFHDPALAGQRKVWSAQGGKSRSNRARARKELTTDALTSEELIGSLSRVIRRLEDGGIEPGVANAIASVSRAFVAVRDAIDVDERLAELERERGIVHLNDRRSS